MIEHDDPSLRAHRDTEHLTEIHVGRVLQEVGRRVEGIPGTVEHLLVRPEDGRACRGDADERSRVFLPRQDRSVATHRPPHDRAGELPPQAVTIRDARKEVADQHRHPVFAGGPSVPIGIAGVDAREPERAHGSRCDRFGEEVRETRPAHRVVRGSATAGKHHGHGQRFAEPVALREREDVAHVDTGHRSEQLVEQR